MNRTSLAQTVAPVMEPISLTEAKAHLRVTESVDDTYIADLITMATRVAQVWQNRQLVNATWVAKYDRFPRSDDDPIPLPYPPLVSVASITYLDTDGNSQTWATTEYNVHIGALRGLVKTAFEKSYPDTRDTPEAVTVQFVAGYGAAATDVPYTTRQGIKLLVSQFFEHREPVIVGVMPASVPMSASWLLDMEKVLEIF